MVGLTKARPNYRRNGTHVNNKIIGVSAAGKHGENGAIFAKMFLENKLIIYAGVNQGFKNMRGSTSINC